MSVCPHLGDGPGDELGVLDPSRAALKPSRARSSANAGRCASISCSSAALVPKARSLNGSELVRADRSSRSPRSRSSSPSACSARYPPRGVGVWVTLRRPGRRGSISRSAGEARDRRATSCAMSRSTLASTNRYERVAQVVHSSVTALIDDSIEVARTPRNRAPARSFASRCQRAPREQGPQRPAPKLPAPVPSEPKRPLRSSSALAGDFLPGCSPLDDEGFAHGPGLMLGAAFDFGQSGVGAVARGHYALPHRQNVRRIGRRPVRVLRSSRCAGLRRLFGAFRARFLELGGGVAWVRYDPEARGVSTAPAPRDTDQRFFWFGSGGFRSTSSARSSSVSASSSSSTRLALALRARIRPRARRFLPLPTGARPRARARLTLSLPSPSR